jgi:FtsP/CotA-like multicopper oxidase with cupredoxin domain
MRRVFLTAASLVAFLAAAAAAQSDLCPAARSPAGVLTAALRGSLYCMDLVPIPDLRDITAVLELRPVPTANGISVSRDGHARYQLTAVIDGLPAPESLGNYRAYVAWATTLALDSTIRLGSVRAGRNDLGEISLDQFRVFVTAEARADGVERTGKLVLRGTSPSTRLMAHRDMTRAGPLGGAGTHADSSTHGHEHGVWPMPPMDPSMPAMPGMESLRPNVDPYLPRAALTAPLARPRQVVLLNDGDTLRLEAGLVRRRIAGKTFTMFGFNGQYPGPLIRTRQAATVVIDFRNALDQPSTIHWHGVRLDNRFDGVPHLTQDPVPPGGRFLYSVHLPDAGIYWYHPHHREDIQQELGLYGNLLVDPADPAFYAPANDTQLLMLDDLLVGDAGLLPFGADTPTHALMGRFGNVFLVNGEPDYRFTADAGAVVRFFLTNVSNTRVFNVSFGGARMKLVGSDVGKFEREEWVESVLISPAERYIVDVRFERAGRYNLENRVRALNHVFGTYSQEIDTLGSVDVRPRTAAPDLGTAFGQLRENLDVIRDIDRYRNAFNRPPDRELVLTMQARDLPPLTAAMATGFPVPIDFNDAMGMMNWAATGKQISWIVREPSTGRENMDLSWKFRRGEIVRLRIFNDPAVFHAMAHPIHLHGQRLLVLSRNHVVATNRVWKDTALIQAGETVELLVEMSNPGKWMLHCHIAEHLGSGMMMVFEVN